MEIKILSSVNKHLPYLYNQVVEVIRKEKLQAQVNPRSIILPNVAEDIVKRFKELGIKLER